MDFPPIDDLVAFIVEAKSQTYTCYGGPHGISTDAGGPYEVGNEVTFHFLQGDVSTGPAILRVHVHDQGPPSAATRKLSATA